MAKSRTDKGGKGSNVPTPAIAHEIVPGKFTDHDWLFMVDRDDGDEFITDIIEDLAGQVTDRIFVDYISRQLIPYTVLQAREAIVQIIQWQFLTTDEGETNLLDDPGWTPDEEPIPAATDSWAQGSVPKMHITLSPLGETVEQGDDASELQSSDEFAEKLEMEEDREEVETEEAVTATTDMDSVAVEESSVIREDPCVEIFQQNLMAEPCPPKRKKAKKKFKPYTGVLSTDSLTKITESLERTEMEMLARELPPQPTPSPEPGLTAMPASCQSLIKHSPGGQDTQQLQAGRPPGLKDVIYDEHGNVIGVARIDLHKVPSRRVKTGFEIIDPVLEESQARLEAMRTGRYMGTLRPRVPPVPEVRKQSGRRYTLGMVKQGMALQNAAFSNMTKSKGSITPLPPPLIECMEVSPGVVVREGERVKRGPKQRPKKPGIFAMVKDLRPITAKALVTSLSVSDLLDNSSPTVKSLPTPPPIPPIPTSAT
ncbi:hypothetical protein LSAT2_011632 [Lamellibrachia satsuma]|nr:hypothetical protein LSAT2_011632 [Lamellibrachia satsuma]